MNWLQEWLGNFLQQGEEQRPGQDQRRQEPPATRTRRTNQGGGAVAMGFPTSLFGAGAAMGGHMAQGNHLQGMANQATNALEEENRSRVAQAREARRLQHEMSLRGMEYQALLARLAHERWLAERRMRYEAGMKGMSDDKARGVISSTRWNKMFD